MIMMDCKCIYRPYICLTWQWLWPGSLRSYVNMIDKNRGEII